MTKLDSMLPLSERPQTPGELLNNKYLKPLGITQQQLADRLGITRVRLNEVLLGKRSISMDTAIRLSCFFDTTAEYWIERQVQVDKWDALKANLAEYKKITPLEQDDNFVKRLPDN